MKRAAIVTGVTVVGVVWLLTYKVTPPQLSALARASLPRARNPASPSPSPVGAHVAVGTPRRPVTVALTLPQPRLNGTFTGSDVPNRFGDVQVRVVISNGRITDVQAVQLPSDRAESAYISQRPARWLRTEALQAQSANIDIISGATYTSQSYAQSLEIGATAGAPRLGTHQLQSRVSRLERPYLSLVAWQEQSDRGRCDRGRILGVGPSTTKIRLRIVLQKGLPSLM